MDWAERIEQILDGVCEHDYVLWECASPQHRELAATYARFIGGSERSYWYAPLLHSCMNVTGSPLEAAFLGAIVAAFTGGGMVCVSSPKNGVFGCFGGTTAEAWHYKRTGTVPEKRSTDKLVFVEPQRRIGTYRADFVIRRVAGGRAVSDAGLDGVAIVECDGHDYHERTKAQARHDRKRDRETQATGMLVLRYTGAEIWGDPIGCARDVEDKILDRSYQMHEASEARGQ